MAVEKSIVEIIMVDNLIDLEENCMNIHEIYDNPERCGVIKEGI